MTVNCPGDIIFITPPHIHIHLSPIFKAGKFPHKTFGDEGIHGLTVIGIQGIGVKTPKAAVVAAKTVGFARLVHIAKGEILIIGANPIIFPIGRFDAKTLSIGKNLTGIGDIPKEHTHIPPVTHFIGILNKFSFDFRIYIHHQSSL